MFGLVIRSTYYLYVSFSKTINRSDDDETGSDESSDGSGRERHSQLLNGESFAPERANLSFTPLTPTLPAFTLTGEASALRTRNRMWFSTR